MRTKLFQAFDAFFLFIIFFKKKKTFFHKKVEQKRAKRFPRNYYDKS